MKTLAARSICALLLASLCGAAAHASAQASTQASSYPANIHPIFFEPLEVTGFDAQTPIHAVFEDSKGRIWLGMEDRLAMFDGADLFYFDAEDSASSGLETDFVRAIEESPDGTVWVGTWGDGLYVYNERKSAFEKASYEVLPGKPAFDNRIWEMTFDEAGNLWVGTFTSGLFMLDAGSRELRPMLQYDSATNKTGNRVNALLHDSKGRIWASMTSRELVVIDSNSERFLLRWPYPEDASPYVEHMLETSGGRVLVAFENFLFAQEPEAALGDFDQLHEIEIDDSRDGFRLIEEFDGNRILALLGNGDVLLLDADGQLLNKVPTHPGKPFNLPPMIPWAITTLESGDILIGTGNGAWVSTALSRGFRTLAVEADDASLLRASRFVKYAAERLWINSDNLLWEIPVSIGEDEITVTGPAIRHRPSSHFITGLVEHAGRLIATTVNSIESFDLTRRRWTRVKVSEYGGYDPTVIENDIWTGSLGGGFKVLRAATGYSETEPFPPVPGIRLNRRIISLHEDGETLWGGSFTGMLRFDLASETYLPLSADSRIVQRLDSALVANILPWRDKLLLVGDFGLLIASHDATGITLLEKPDLASLSGETLLAGARLPDGRFVVANAESLLVLDKDLKLVNRLDKDLGLPNVGLYTAAMNIVSDNWVAMGGNRTSLLFRSDDAARLQASRPTLHVSKIESVLEEGVTEWLPGEKIRFGPEDRLLHFTFGLQDIHTPLNNRYSFLLEGFNEDWVNLGRRREISFTSLSPGQYTLYLRGDDGSGHRSEVSLGFQVFPVWWRSTWAYSAYALMLFGILYFYWSTLQKRIARERRVSSNLREADRIKSHFLTELESRVEESTRDLRLAVEALEIKNVELAAAEERATDASKLKSEFLANMSHEIRTPLNGVLGFVQLLRKTPLDTAQNDYVQTIEQSSVSLLNVINDVLDISKIEAGKLAIDDVGFNSRQCFAGILESMAPIAYQKDLDLFGVADPSVPIGLRGDPNRFRQVAVNLISNAIKYTDRGHVTATARFSEDRLWVTVEDTGQGIPPETRERLFKSFERGERIDALGQGGAGLGLAISKKIIEAMGGDIWLESTVGEGTAVTFNVPIKPDRNPENRYSMGNPLDGKRIRIYSNVRQMQEGLENRFAKLGAEISQDTSQLYLQIIAISRKELNDTSAQKGLLAACIEGVPIIAHVASVDRMELQKLSELLGFPCLPYIGNHKTQVRVITELLGVAGFADAQMQTPGKKPLKGMQVIVADDNRINRHFLRRMLELNGAIVREADNGNGAIKAVQNHEPDCLLLDMHMPDMNGTEVAKSLRRSGYSKFPIIAVSANIRQETRQEATAAGINAYLLKPVSEDQLIESITAWCRKKKKESGA